jgi:uncharacterized protein (TIGR02452 family)
MNREKRTALAQETVKILERGTYIAPSGNQVDISDDLQRAITGSRLFRPEDFPSEIAAPDPTPFPAGPAAEVTPETTLEAAQRLASAGTDEVCCLNFASAKNPGGGFLSGSQAQEESIARSSGLYACLQTMREMYEHNRRRSTSLYSDHMIYSPGVPVFRDDDGRLLESPYTIAIITAPAVNAGAVRQNERQNIPLIRPTLASRLEKILWVAARYNHERLVLGAWGCGVFANDPAEIAELFAEALGTGGKFGGVFRETVYAVYDRSSGQEVLGAFRRRLGG